MRSHQVFAPPNIARCAREGNSEKDFLIWQNFRTPVAAPLDNETDDLRRRRVRRQAQIDPQGIVPDRDGSGGALERFDCLDRAVLSKGRRRSPDLSADGDAARALDAELVRLQRSGDGRSAVLNHHPTSVFWSEP